MTLLKSVLAKGVFIALVAGNTVPVASAASANVVCDRAGDCWRDRDRLAYPDGVGFTFHTDAWGVAHRAGHWRWQRDHFDRGYVRNGVWIAS